jgi:hypothetical protein
MKNRPDRRHFGSLVNIVYMDRRPGPRPDSSKQILHDSFCIPVGLADEHSRAQASDRLHFSPTGVENTKHLIVAKALRVDRLHVLRLQYSGVHSLYNTERNTLHGSVPAIARAQQLYRAHLPCSWSAILFQHRI